MADPGFPNQHMTTTGTTTVTNTTVTPVIRFDKTYLRTTPGILKVAQIILDLIGFICISVSYQWWQSRGGWFNTVSMTGFWFTGIMLLFYLFHVIEKFYKVPWLKIEFVFCAVWTFFYLLAASLAADYGRHDEAYGAAAFFGFAAMVVYGFDAYLKFVAVRSGGIAQGQRTVQKTTSTVTSPAY